MRRQCVQRVLVPALAVAAGLCLAAAAHGQEITPQTLRDEHVRQGIRAIVQGLYDRRHPERLWEPAAGRGEGSQYQVGGYTALVTLALLYAGESYQSKELRDVIDHLESVQLQGTYAVAVRASVWAILPPRFREYLERDATWLMDGFSEDVGGWTYYQLPSTEVRDNSLRQYGALGLWEAAKRGVWIPEKYWEGLERGYLQMQLADGGWNYRGDGPATGSMTAAGLATLLIIQDFLHAEDALSLRDRNRPPSQRAIDDALQWMHENFSATENPNSDKYFYYYLYGVERVGLAGGYKYFGGRDWYREGAAELLRRLCAWDDQTQTMTLYEQEGGGGASIRNDDLAFALMFLSRGRMASVVNKLQDEDIAWNNRPRDVPNFAAWLAGETARHVLWQVTDINAPAEQWLDAPMQYFASHRQVPWAEDADDPRMQRLKQYLDRGGLLFAVNEGRGRAFAESMIAAGSTLYPDYVWRVLPDDHWAYTVHHPVRSNRPQLRGLSNGVRELMIVAEAEDFAATFQVRNHDNMPHYHTAGNVYFYASEMGRPRSRLASLEDVSTEDTPPSAVTARVVHAEHDGQWNAEPHALPALKAWLAKQGIAISVEQHALSEIDTLGDVALVHVSGIDAQRLTTSQERAITRYVNSGGTILFETAGGMGDFADNAEPAMHDLFDAQAQSLRRSSIITGNDIDLASDLSRVDYRPYTLEVLGTLETLPRLRGILVDDTPRILFSSDDLSHALLDQPCWGISGYTADSARAMMRNIILHAIDAREKGSW